MKKEPHIVILDGGRWSLGPSIRVNGVSLLADPCRPPRCSSTGSCSKWFVITERRRECGNLSDGFARWIRICHAAVGDRTPCDYPVSMNERIREQEWPFS